MLCLSWARSLERCQSSSRQKSKVITADGGGRVGASGRGVFLLCDHALERLSSGKMLLKHWFYVTHTHTHKNHTVLLLTLYLYPKQSMGAHGHKNRAHSTPLKKKKKTCTLTAQQVHTTVLYPMKTGAVCERASHPSTPEGEYSSARQSLRSHLERQQLAAPELPCSYIHTYITPSASLSAST